MRKRTSKKNQEKQSVSQSVSPIGVPLIVLTSIARMDLLPPGMDDSTPSYFDEDHFKHHPAFHTAIFGQSDSGKTSAIVQWLLRRDGPAYNGFEQIHGFTKKAKKNIGSIWELMLEDPEYNK